MRKRKTKGDRHKSNIHNATTKATTVGHKISGLILHGPPSQFCYFFAVSVSFLAWFFILQTNSPGKTRRVGRYANFVQSLYCYCQNGGKTSKTWRVCSWTNKITRPFPIDPQIFYLPNRQKQNPRPHLLTFGYY